MNCVIAIRDNGGAHNEQGSIKLRYQRSSKSCIMIAGLHSQDPPSLGIKRNMTLDLTNLESGTRVQVILEDKDWQPRNHTRHLQTL